MEQLRVHRTAILLSSQLQQRQRRTGGVLFLYLVPSGKGISSRFGCFLRAGQISASLVRVWGWGIMDTLTLVENRPTDYSFSRGSLGSAAQFVLRLRSIARSWFASGFSDSAWHLLLALCATSGAGRALSIGDLAACVGIPRTTTIRLLTKLVSKGFVRLARDPGDRRIVRVQLTSAGLEAMQYCLAAASERDPDKVGLGNEEGIEAERLELTANPSAESLRAFRPFSGREARL